MVKPDLKPLYRDRTRAGGCPEPPCTGVTALLRAGGTDPATLSGEKGTEKDHHMCEGPRAATLGKKDQTKQYPRQGKLQRPLRVLHSHHTSHESQEGAVQ